MHGQMVVVGERLRNSHDRLRYGNMSVVRVLPWVSYLKMIDGRMPFRIHSEVRGSSVFS